MHWVGSPACNRRGARIYFPGRGLFVSSATAAGGGASDWLRKLFNYVDINAAERFDMAAFQTSPPFTGAPLVPDRERLLRATAAMLGLSATEQTQFAQTGRLRRGDIAFALLAHDTEGAPLTLLACATLPRPTGVESSAWHDALLTANEAAILAAEWGFALEEDDSASLLMKLPDAMHAPELLRAALDSMFSLCLTVSEAAARKSRAPEVVQ